MLSINNLFKMCKKHVKDRVASGPVAGLAEPPGTSCGPGADTEWDGITQSGHAAPSKVVTWKRRRRRSSGPMAVRREDTHRHGLGGAGGKRRRI